MLCKPEGLQFPVEIGFSGFFPLNPHIRLFKGLCREMDVGRRMVVQPLKE